ncbi:hypothetical protein [Longimicrobium terrae]|uniref:Uncharacterized protein YoxC n=1 Tax=Longimicrobium terrae TaxID=1639882 RepID=A0A841H7X8_9BACT|nr:hypothetical protein [Longimicrobium terrae]MBB4637903.1 uncharacterized protein YoxC [Longimicrobium terrae]MBB6074002.1 uncharacterized protein YoxC [Longimicrobium terrae]NNC31163.1 hypothetical protein [Longimicrobium terrae]
MIHPPLLLIQAAPGGFEHVVRILADVATIVIALALIAIGLAAIAAALKVRGMIRRMRGDLKPVTKHLEAAAANVGYLSAAVRQDVEAVGKTVRGTSERVERVAESAERRLNDIHALLDVMQAEAETLFIRTASAVRGVQTGAGSFVRMQRGPEEWDAAGGADDLEPARPARRTFLDD